MLLTLISAQKIGTITENGWRGGMSNALLPGSKAGATADMAEPLAEALIAQLVRSGVLSDGDIAAIADALDAANEPDAAHQARVSMIEAQAPTDANWNAEKRRSRLHIVPDGGNDTA